MQDWDRLVMVGVGALVSAYTGVEGWRLWKKKKYLAVAGVVLLMAGATGTPILLALFAT
ncbi:MAG TPA: YgaP-like transmembrane domain [Symbiobacteriaceae bacterium]|jgi:hypothetical protein|nr:YgaP-like transmembrane domain [Symbiobacteriaceae bacterium]